MNPEDEERVKEIIKENLPNKKINEPGLISQSVEVVKDKPEPI